MNKDKFIECGILIAANELEVEPIDYAIDYRGILKENDISGLYDPLKNLIVINSDWINEASNNDILQVVFHEMRHFYQKKQIDFLRKGLDINEEKIRILKWENEFSIYVKPNQSNRKLYADQTIEKDAFEFSKSLLNKVLSLIS